MRPRGLQAMLLLLLLTAAGAALPAQAWNRPFVRKFEVGYPNLSRVTSIWPTDSGYFMHMTKIDSLPRPMVQ